MHSPIRLASIKRTKSLSPGNFQESISSSLKLSRRASQFKDADDEESMPATPSRSFLRNSTKAMLDIRPRSRSIASDNSVLKEVKDAKKTLSFSLGSDVDDPEPAMKRTMSEPVFNSWDYGHEIYADMYGDEDVEETPDTSEATDPTDEHSTEDIEEDDGEVDPDTLFDSSVDPPTSGLRHSATARSSKPRSSRVIEADDIIFRTNEYGKVSVVAGTIEKLVRNLACEDLPNSEYIQVFILSHTRFITSESLLSMLTANFDHPKPLRPDPSGTLDVSAAVFIQSRIINVIKMWLGASRRDFEPPEMNAKLRDFIANLQASSQDNQKHWGNNLQGTLQGNEDDQDPATPKVFRKKSNTFSSLLRRRSVAIDRFLDMQPRDVAKQITLIDQAMLRKLQPRDLLNKCWDKSKPPPLEGISKRFDLVSGWVTSEVVTTANHKQRLLVVTNFVLLIEELLRVNNFHSAMSVYVGLGKTPVTRLKETWRALDRRIMDKWEGIESLMTPLYNFKALRASIAKAKRPIIPPITILMKDLTFMEENSDHYAHNDKLLNFEKIMLIGQVLVDIHECQRTKYDLQEDAPMKEYLLDKMCVLSTSALDMASKLVVQGSKSKSPLTPRSPSSLSKGGSLLRIFGDT